MYNEAADFLHQFIRMEAAYNAEADQVFVQRELLLQNLIVAALADRDFELGVLLNALDNGLGYSSILMFVVLPIILIALLNVLHRFIVGQMKF